MTSQKTQHNNKQTFFVCNNLFLDIVVAKNPHQTRFSFSRYTYTYALFIYLLAASVRPCSSSSGFAFPRWYIISYFSLVGGRANIWTCWFLVLISLTSCSVVRFVCVYCDLIELEKRFRLVSKCKMPQHGRKSSLTVEQEKEVYMGRRGSLNSLSPPKVDGGDRRRGSLLARYVCGFRFLIQIQEIQIMYLSLCNVCENQKFLLCLLKRECRYTMIHKRNKFVVLSVQINLTSLISKK